MSRCRIWLLAFAILGFASSAQAQLVALTFDDTAGEQKTVSPEKRYINPSREFQALVSSGLDRRIRLTVKNDQGHTVATAQSDLIGPNDRLTVDGRTYNGSALTIPSLVDGTYSFTTEILAVSGATVETSQATIVIDKTPPVVAGEITRSREGYPIDVFPRISNGEDSAGALMLRGVQDSSGIEKAVFFAISDSGTGERREMEAILDQSSGMVEAKLYAIADRGLTPHDHHYYRIGFDIYDRAGNKATIDRVSGVDRSLPELHVSVWNPLIEKWEPYAQNMVVHQNPVRYRVGVKKEEHQAFSSSDFRLISPGVQSHDDVYAYIAQVNITVPIREGQRSGPYIVYSRHREYFRPENYPVKLAPGLEEGPQVIGVAYHPAEPMVSKSGQILEGWQGGNGMAAADRSLDIRAGAPYVVNKLRINAEPRNYVQRAFSHEHGWECLIPANETSCVMDTNLTHDAKPKGYISTGLALERVGVSDLRASIPSMWQVWDFNPPTINYANVDANAKTISVQVNDPDRVDSWQIGFWETRDIRAYATNKATGHRLEIGRQQGTYVSTNINESSFRYDSLPDGVYTFEVAATDTYGNSVTEAISGDYIVDNTAPQTTITSPTSIASLDEVVVRVHDTLDPSPAIKSIKLTGGPGDEEIYLSWRTLGGGNYGLEYPLLFPSLQENEEYTLTVQAGDWQYNEATASAQFVYSPPTIELADGMDGRIMIPAVSHTFVHPDGANVIETEPVTLADGSAVAGTYDVFAVLRSDAAVAMIVNGVLLEPGSTQSIISQHNFASSGGRLSIPVMPAAPGVSGSSSLLITTSAPNSPVLSVEIVTWRAEGRLSATTWEVRQVIDPLNFSVTPAPGVPCRFTADEKEARSANPIRDPVCLVEWTKKPDEALASNGSEASLRGQAYQIGQQPVQYTLSMFNGNGQKVVLGQDERPLTVTSAKGSVGFGPADDIALVHRIIQDVEFRPRQTFGPTCSVTTDADFALLEGSKMGANKVCLFEWQSIPNGMNRYDSQQTPALGGALPTTGKHSVGWRVSVFSRSGNRITLAEQIYDIEAVDPPSPDIEITGAEQFQDGLYMVPLKGSYLGDAVISSERASLDVQIQRNGSLLESNTFQPGWSSSHTVYRRINTDSRELWDSTAYNITAAYSDVPEVKREFNFTAVTVPADSIRPVLETVSTEVVDTDLLPLRVTMRDQYQPNEGYNAETMGEWRVRVVRQMTYGNSEPLTDFVPMSDGEATFAIDISELGVSSLRLSAEAMLVSQVEGYERTVSSARPVFMAVLRGGAIEADVSARRLSGAAPFVAQIKLSLESNADMRAAGDVIWQTKKDGASDWHDEATSAGDRNRFQYVKSFEEGTYEVRAKIINANSGLESYSQPLEIVAYNKLDIEVRGQTMMFVGGTTRLTASLQSDDAEIEEGAAVIEWSLDGGRTYTETGPYVDVSSDEEARLRVWSRVRDQAAPEDDRYAYSISKTTVQFRPVKAPRIRVIGPRSVEAGKTYEFVADVRHPYTGMDDEIHGYFTLPDGTTAQGEAVAYTPTEEDLASGAIEIGYVAWIEGYRDQQAEASHALRTRVWQYVWPKFAIQLRSPALVAPADVVAQVREVAFKGKLEDPTFEWDVPGNATVTEARDKLRAFRIEEPGEYTVSVTARDSRGNETLVEYAFVVEEAEPFNIDLRFSGSNAIAREPLDILVRPGITGGHPRDRILTRTYMVNGEALDGNGNYGRATLLAGSNEVKLSISTEMGVEASGNLTIDVKENQLPSCTLSSRETATAWIVSADCEDEDGRIKSHEWTVNGEPQSIRGNRLTISKSRYEGSPGVSVVAVDDSGGRSPEVSLH